MEKQLHDILRELSQTIRKRYETRGSQKRILSLIFENQPVTQQELIEITGITSPSMSEQLTKLEHSGWIFRSKSDSDGRVFIISLTDSGCRQAVKNYKELQINVQKEYAAVSDSEKSELVILIQKLLKSWKEADAK